MGEAAEVNGEGEEDDAEDDADYADVEEGEGEDDVGEGEGEGGAMAIARRLGRGRGAWIEEIRGRGLLADSLIMNTAVTITGGRQFVAGGFGSNLGGSGGDS